ncbi:helix-turn-helix domain-containing protein [Isobaculum melis]|uniref:DNA-binding transcriptional regulator, XRE-family HTH domain n=1 Tax=Isobaculum melis TaxID=142588 RepID=A0A1H9TNY0_9LACT|nr:helix-turn-helix transcriptional regulator [Isobaculum melis]SER98855.1 DNA-binding transcriptional regulator, XRE-family HTH domain [Isobaculum melis]
MLADKLKELRNKKNLTQKELAQLLNVSQQTIGSWEVGRAEPNNETLILLSEIFNVSTDYLLGKKNDKQYWELTEKEEKDVGKQIDKILDGMENDTDINFYGEPMSHEDRELLANALEIGLRLSKEKAKKKFTRKDYRD